MSNLRYFIFLAGRDKFNSFVHAIYSLTYLLNGPRTNSMGEYNIDSEIHASNPK